MVNQRRALSLRCLILREIALLGRQPLAPSALRARRGRLLLAGLVQCAMIVPLGGQRTPQDRHLATRALPAALAVAAR